MDESPLRAHSRPSKPNKFRITASHNAEATSHTQNKRSNVPHEQSTQTLDRSQSNGVGDDVDDSDWKAEVIMALDMKEKDTFGCCYYTASDRSLYLLSETRGGGTEIIDNLRTYIQPTIILISSKISENVETHLRSTVSNSLDTDHIQTTYRIEARTPQEFGYDAAMNKLNSVIPAPSATESMTFYVPGNDDMDVIEADASCVGFTATRSKWLRLSSLIDTGCRASIGCAGAVLTFVGRRRALDLTFGIERRTSSFEISKLEVFSLKNTMLLNPDTLMALQILQPEINPKARSQRPSDGASGSKEGLSIYGLYQHLARTPQGKQLLRQYLIRPSLDLNVINERLDTISTFLLPKNTTPFNSIVGSLKSVKNIRATLVNLKKGINGSNGWQVSSNVWSSLRKVEFAYHALQIRDSMMEVEGCDKIAVGLKVLTRFNTRALAQVGEQISDIVIPSLLFRSHETLSEDEVDFQTSLEMHRTVIRAGYDRDLDHKKRTYDGIEDLLNKISRDIAATIPPEYGVELNVIFFPQIGFLISIPIDEETGRAQYAGSDNEDEAWDLIFSTAIRFYFKDYRMREMDDTLGDMYAVICDREIEIGYELGQRVLASESVLNEASDICGELDCLLAFAQGAKLYKLSRPQVILENVIDIVGGRHPLQELIVPSYVANDTKITGHDGDEVILKDQEGAASKFPRAQTTRDGDRTNMLIMTGPNYSGKSVYLKQIALIVYLGHVGCFVPADRAVIGLTDKILTRIATRETVSKMQSAFMIDLHQIALAMKLVTHRSLLIIDEFGKGTDSNDGAGLFCGVIRHLMSRENHSPKVLAATHYHEIFEKGLLRASPRLNFGHMEIKLDEGAESVDDQVTYLYNVRPGWNCSSFGSHCAAINGVDASIVDRSEELVLLCAQGQDLVAACAKVSQQEEKELRDAENIARSFLQENFPDTVSENGEVNIARIVNEITPQGSRVTPLR